LKTRILQPTTENFQVLGEALRHGELVGMPTETVYGLAGAALDPTAVSKIFEAKERPTFDPLIVHVEASANSLAKLSELRLVDSSRLTSAGRASAELLMKQFWPGPLTLVLPKFPDVPDLVTSGLATVAVRIPNHPSAQALLSAARVPLAAPSANRFGRISPTSADAVLAELGGRIGWILDGGRSDVGLESTVAAITAEGHARILRPGGITAEKISSRTGIRAFMVLDMASEENSHEPAGTDTPQQSPGALSSHYAPAKPMLLLPARISQLTPDHWKNLRATLKQRGVTKVGLLLMEGSPDADETAQNLFERNLALEPAQVISRSLSASGDLREIAHQLFAGMRALDDSAAELLLSEPCPSQAGLGFAISDRLRRACIKPQASES